MAELVEVVRRDLEEASRALEALLHNEAMLASVADAGRAIAAALRAGGKVYSGNTLDARSISKGAVIFYKK